MQTRLLLDANISWRSIDILKKHFDNCFHVDSIGLQVPAKDSQIWEYAKQHQMIIVTNDEDFLHLAAIKGFPPKVILIRTGNQSRKQIEQLLMKMKHQITQFPESIEYGVLELI